jgi:hypothetical protein
MSLYFIARAIHILGGLGMFTALGVELAAASALAGARTTDQVRRALAVNRVNGVIGPLALVLLLIPGLYMATTWHWLPWLRVAFMTLIAIFVLGGVLTRRRLSALVKMLPSGEQRLSLDVERQIHHPVLRVSLGIRAFLTVGILILMTTKPPLLASIGVIALAAAVGAAVAVLYPASPRAVISAPRS